MCIIVYCTIAGRETCVLVKNSETVNTKIESQLASVLIIVTTKAPHVPDYHRHSEYQLLHDHASLAYFAIGQYGRRLN